MKLLVLIVEDEPPQVELLGHSLEKEGFRAIVAGDGEEALAKIAEEAPDLVILDWMLPNLSGIEVCRRLRERPETKRLPVLMLTARRGGRPGSSSAPTTSWSSRSRRAK